MDVYINGAYVLPMKNARKHKMNTILNNQQQRLERDNNNGNSNNSGNNNNGSNSNNPNNNNVKKNNNAPKYKRFKKKDKLQRNQHIASTKKAAKTTSTSSPASTHQQKIIFFEEHDSDDSSDQDIMECLDNLVRDSDDDGMDEILLDYIQHMNVSDTENTVINQFTFTEEMDFLYSAVKSRKGRKKHKAGPGILSTELIDIYSTGNFFTASEDSDDLDDDEEIDLAIEESYRKSCRLKRRNNQSRNKAKKAGTNPNNSNNKSKSPNNKNNSGGLLANTGKITFISGGVLNNDVDEESQSQQQPPQQSLSYTSTTTTTTTTTSTTSSGKKVPTLEKKVSFQLINDVIVLSSSSEEIDSPPPSHNSSQSTPSPQLPSYHHQQKQQQQQVVPNIDLSASSTSTLSSSTSSRTDEQISPRYLDEGQDLELADESDFVDNEDESEDDDEDNGDMRRVSTPSPLFSQDMMERSGPPSDDDDDDGKMKDDDDDSSDDSRIVSCYANGSEPSGDEGYFSNPFSRLCGGSTASSSFGNFNSSSRRSCSGFSSFGINTCPTTPPTPLSQPLTPSTPLTPLSKPCFDQLAYNGASNNNPIDIDKLNCINSCSNSRSNSCSSNNNECIDVPSSESESSDESDDPETERRGSFADWIKKVHGSSTTIKIPPKNAEQELIDVDNFEPFTNKDRGVVVTPPMPLDQVIADCLRDNCTEVIKNDIELLHNRGLTYSSYTTKQLSSISTLFDCLIMNSYHHEFPLWSMSKVSLYQIQLLTKNYNIFSCIKKIRNRKTIFVNIQNTTKKPSIRKKERFIEESFQQSTNYKINDSMFDYDSSDSESENNNNNHHNNNNNNNSHHHHHHNRSLSLSSSTSSTSHTPRKGEKTIHMGRKGKTSPQNMYEKFSKKNHKQHHQANPKNHNHHKSPQSSPASNGGGGKRQQMLHGEVVDSDRKPIGESNIGNLLLKKMGWVGGGLGAQEQGIVAPVQAVVRKDRLGLGF